MKLKNIAAVFAAFVLAFAVMACDDNKDEATDAPESPMADMTEAPAE